MSAKGLTGPGYDGHAFWDTEGFVLPLLTYTAARAPPPTRCAGGRSILDLARQRAAHARAGRRGLPVADDPRPGVLGVLAGGHGGLPPQRRHRPGLRALPGRHRRRRPRARVRRSSCSSRPPGCGPRSATTTGTGAWHVDGVTGPGRVLRGRRRQRLHQPDGRAQPAQRRGRLRPAPRPRGRSASREERDRAVAARTPTRCTSRTTRSSGCTRSREGFTRYDVWDFEAFARPLPAACCTRRTCSCTASRCSSRPTWCWRCSGSRTRSRAEQKARNVDYYERITVRDSSLSACTQSVMCAEVGPPRAGPRLRARGGPGRPARPAPQQQGRPAPGLAGRRLVDPRGGVRRRCASTASCWGSTRQLPDGTSTGSRSGCCGRACGCASRCSATGPAPPPSSARCENGPDGAAARSCSAARRST